MAPKRTAGILKDLEVHFGPEFLTDLWHNVQFGKSSGITCVEIVMTQMHIRNHLGLSYLAEESIGLTSVTRRCAICNTSHSIDVDMTMRKFLEAHKQWLDGSMIQNAFPDSLPEDREFLLSAICPACWAHTFPDEDEDE